MKPCVPLSFKDATTTAAARMQGQHQQVETAAIQETGHGLIQQHCAQTPGVYQKVLPNGPP